MHNWANRAAKAESNYIIEGKPVFRIGRYMITIEPPGEGDEHPHLLYTDERRSPYGSTPSSDPKKTFPNIEVIDGVMQLTIEDIAEFILARVTPLEVAKALWDDEDVRAEFVYCMSENYNGQGITDHERRLWLAKVQKAVHAKAVFDLADALRKAEMEMGRQFDVWRQINSVNNFLSERDIKDRDGKPLRLRDPGDHPAFKIGGEIWQVALEHWRTMILQHFPAPVIPKKEPGKTPPDEDIF
jgi:hypothetical protein